MRLGGRRRAERGLERRVRVGRGRTPARPLQVREAGARGAAICGALAAGVHPDYASAVDAMVAIERRHDPDPDAAALYPGAPRDVPGCPRRDQADVGATEREQETKVY